MTPAIHILSAAGLVLLQALLFLVVFFKGARLERYGILWATLFITNLYFAARMVIDTGIITVTF